METTWNAALWPQFGAAIDTLEHALVACPAALWHERLWPSAPEPPFPPRFAEFWYVTYHALVWIDLYLSGVPEEEFAPPFPLPKERLIPSRHHLNGPIPRRSCAPIWHPCARSAAPR